MAFKKLRHKATLITVIGISMVFGIVKLTQQAP
jgi:hypothetical protein